MAKARGTKLPGLKDRTERQKTLVAKKALQRLLDTHPCGECSACCTVKAVAEINKLEDTQCAHLLHDYDNGGCGIYKDRPTSCRDFFCAYRFGLLGSDEEMRPDLLGLLLEVVPQPPPGIMMLSVREVGEGAIERNMKALHEFAAMGHVLYLITGERRRFMGPEDRVKACAEWSRRHLPLVAR